MRLAISAAAALVKVRHRIDSGAAPFSNRRSTRAVSTCVLPVPAEADSAAWTSRVGGQRLLALSFGKGLNRVLMRLPNLRATAIDAACA